MDTVSDFHHAVNEQSKSDVFLQYFCQKELFSNQESDQL
jgi:hypothetical protein